MSDSHDDATSAGEGSGFGMSVAAEALGEMSLAGDAAHTTDSDSAVG